MKLQVLPGDFSICKLKNTDELSVAESSFSFTAKTDAELSLLCETEYAPSGAIAREDGWRGFRIAGELDFSLTGILSPIAALLAAEKIGIFAVSSYNTDYVFIKRENFEKALLRLEKAGYEIEAVV